MIDEETVFLRLCNAYLQNAEKYPAGSEAFQKQVPTLSDLLKWLSDGTREQYTRLLADLFLKFSPALEAGFNHSLTEKFIEKCIAAGTVESKKDAYELCMIAYRAFWATGDWEKAERYLRLAVEHAQDLDQLVLAESLRVLGGVQINKGDFREALVTLDKSSALFKEVGDKEGEVAILKEKAAYYLDKGDFVGAEKMYREAGSFEQEMRGAFSPHSLLMLGVVTRRQGKTEEALAYLNELQSRAQKSGSKDELAVAAHHMAWAHMNMQKYELALNEARASQRLFKEINDPRGESDVDEQLGEIFQALGNFDESKFYYECCVNIRILLENKQGLASVSRRLARLYFRKSSFFKGFYYLFRSSLIYLRIGMLNKARLQRGIKEVFLRKDLASYPR